MSKLSGMLMGQNFQGNSGGLDLKSMVQGMGSNPTARMLQMDINRGVLPGAKTPGVEGLDPTQLALLDRYAWGQQGGLGGVPVAAGYEALKAVSQLPGMSRVLPGVASALGFENTSNQFENDDTSSPASLQNVLTYIKGALGK